MEHRTGMRLTPSILVRLTRVLILSGRTFFVLRGREDWSVSHVRVGARMSGAGQEHEGSWGHALPGLPGTHALGRLWEGAFCKLRSQSHIGAMD